MITYFSKENNLGPDDKIRHIWGRHEASTEEKYLSKY